MAIVLKNFSLKPESETYITIETRESGLVNFLLNLMGLDPTYRMTCNNDSVDVDCSSLKGSVKQVIPLSAITEVVTSIQKPIKLLFIAFIFFIGALASFAAGMAEESSFIAIGVVAIIISIIFLIMYILKKNILFAIKNGGDGYSAAIHCLPAVIAGERIDSEKFKAAADLLRDKINAANNK